MPFSFPSSPSIGDKSTQNSREYEWSGYAWEIVATPAALSASVITSGTLDAARLPLATTLAAGAVIVGTGLGVSSGTVSVTYGTTGGTACQGNDSRLSDTRTPTDGSVTTATLANDAVTYAKIQNVSATDRLLGRSSAGSGDVEEILCGSFGRSLIGSADAAAARTTLSVQPTASPAFTGTVSAAAASLTGAVTITRSTSTGAVADIPHIVFNNRNFTNATFVAGGVFSNTFRDVADPHYSAGMWFVRSPFSGNFSSSGDIVFGTGENVVQSAFPTERLRIAASGVSTFSGQLLVTAGSASACGVAFSGDVNTGLAQIGGADTASLVTGGVERVRVGSGGRVQFFANDEKFGVQLNKGSTGNGPFIGSDGADIFTISTSGGAERVRVDASGNVGIGASPGTTLDIQRASADAAVFVQGQTSSTGATLQLYSGAGLGYVGTRNNYPLLITSNNAERMRVKTTGSVRFVPLSADPSTGNEAGDVYYNSTTNKLRVYNGTSWVDLH